MNILKKCAAIALSSALIAAALTGCSKYDKSGAQEAAGNFLAAVKSGDENSINAYASSEVAGGDFVKLFDVNSIKEQFLAGFVDIEVEEETTQELDEFCSMFSSLITGYEISEVTVDKDGKATAICTMETRFPIDITSSEESSEMVKEITESYQTQHQDEIDTMFAEEGEEAATARIYNYMTREVLDAYESLIEDSSPENYAIVLTLEKNPETDSWYVTNIQDYDSSVNGTTTPATDTATTELSTLDADAALESASASTEGN